ncbi:hypothetical protein KCTC52924_03908 [Arenibacter antarcticus]|uniref:Uncharacterized protein n=1 Tax=Arenibacter antarcticus TaxID=2040469 RepID=A0ABW5VF68_9FLAO|nr:hypothetical protein [Arenibacter sp. H213]MCM4168341.1 hypothetical protein [Arenibacter sp. H213]
MLLQKTNIQKKLILAKQKDNSSEFLMQEVFDILKEVDTTQKRIVQNLTVRSPKVVNHFDFNRLETSEIYHISHIKKIAINYRLRFLDSHYFKGVIPNEAISKIRSLEKAHGMELQGFKILAPSKLFKLEDRDDPILFAPIDNEYYYLIHKWGNDLHPLRKTLMWSFKSIGNLFITVVAISYLLTLMVPDGLLSKSSSVAQFWIIFFFMFKTIAAIVIYYGFAKGKNFNHAIWNNKYLKT